MPSTTESRPINFNQCAAWVSTSPSSISSSILISTGVTGLFKHLEIILLSVVSSMNGSVIEPKAVGVPFKPRAIDGFEATA